MARLKDKWDQKLKVDGREYKVDIVKVTMFDRMMFGKVKSKNIHEMDVIKRPSNSYWCPTYTEK